MKTFVQVLSVAFFGVFFWIVYWADAGQPSVLSSIWDDIPNGDKYGHVVLFGALALAANVVTGFRVLAVGRFRLFWGTLAAVAIAVVEEFSQAFFPSRTVDMIDLLAGMVGIILATLVSSWWCRRAGKSQT